MPSVQYDVAETASVLRRYDGRYTSNLPQQPYLSLQQDIDVAPLPGLQRSSTVPTIIDGTDLQQCLQRSVLVGVDPIIMTRRSSATV